MPHPRGARRLSKVARREQLIAAAMPILAEQGFTEFPLGAVADGADVTRNLLYHYFPRGRPDIVLAAVDRAGLELTEHWLIDETLPLPERLAANFARMASHAMAPTDAWRIHRRARAADQPELDVIVAGYLEVVISSVSLNHLGTTQPPALVHLTLTGFLAFGETMLDQARLREAPLEQVLAVLAETLVGTIQAARVASST